MSTVGTAGGSFGRQSAPAGGSIAGGQGPSRVIKARLRFMGRRLGAGGAGWAEVEVSDWEGQNDKDDTEGLEFDRIVGESNQSTRLCFPVFVCALSNVNVVGGCVCVCIY